MKLFLIILCSCALLLSGCGQKNSATIYKDSYTDHQGNTGRFSDHKGQWIIINYWAIWCKPCIEEIPELNLFADKMADRIALFAVDFDGTKGEVLQSNILQLDIQFPVLINDPANYFGHEKPNALPTTIIFTPEGKLHKTLLGPQTRESLLKAIE